MRTTLTAGTDAPGGAAQNRALTWLLRVSVGLLALVNVALFRPDGDPHDSAYLVGILVGGLVTQAVVVAIIYGIHRLLRRPKRPMLVIAFWTLLALAALRVWTTFRPPGRLTR